MKFRPHYVNLNYHVCSIFHQSFSCCPLVLCTLCRNLPRKVVGYEVRQLCTPASRAPHGPGGSTRPPSYSVACTLPVKCSKPKSACGIICAFCFLLCTFGRTRQSPIVAFNGPCDCEDAVHGVISIGPRSCLGPTFYQKCAEPEGPETLALLFFSICA